MFAFAIWDMRQEKGTLFLARDRMGQKPLFYASLEDGIVFGSTIGSVLAWPEVPRRVPKEQIGLYLLLGYFPAPQTVWRDVSAVLPGAWVRLRGEVLDGEVYWSKTQTTSHETRSLRETVEAAVASQLVSDVPVACFLSGGIDSSIVAAVMQRAVHAAGGNPIRTVSVGFKESSFDETSYAQTVAKHIGSVHTRLEVTAGGDVMGTLDLLMRTSLGQPFADSSIVPTYHLSRAVRGMATVALAGDGADELFGGYERYRAMELLARWNPIARMMPRSVPIGSLSKQERYRRLAAAARAGIASERYTRLVEIFPLELAEEVMAEDVMDWFPLPEEYGVGDDVSGMRLAMFRDQQEYLPGDVLWKVDSASMCGVTGSTALEVRAPFLDHRVVELANSLDDRELVRGGVGKWVLREAFRDALPAEILGRGKKGFGAPVGEWFKGELRGALREMLFATGAFTTSHLKKAVVERLVAEHERGARDHTHRLFALLMLEIWWRQANAQVE
jgi:asparagine synthase (glutamine-hydrolysing)